MLAFPGVRGVNGSVRRVRVLVSRRDTAVQKLRLRLRPVRLRLFRLHPVRTDACLHHQGNTQRNGLGRLLGKDPLEIDLDVARRGGMEAQQLRAAANAPIQGSSADIIKVAMVQLQDALQRQGLPAQLLLQVHDELVLEVAPDALDAIRELVVQTMEQAVALSVPLVVETGVGANWMEAK